MKWSWNESIWYPMVKLGHLGLEMTQLVQHTISSSNDLEMSQLVSNGKIRSSWSWNDPIGTACYK